MAVHRVGDLEINEDIDFEERQWRVQRISWVVMGLLIVAMLLGVAGTGLLAPAQVEGQAMSLEYERFGHLLTSLELRFRVEAPPSDQQSLDLWLARPYLNEFQVEQVTPQPDSVALAGDRLIYSFKVAEASQPVEITFYLKPTSPGLVEGEAGLSGQSPLSFSQFIYP